MTESSESGFARIELSLVEGGIVVVRKLRARADVPIIVLTGREGIDDKLACFEVGAKKCMECHTAEMKVWERTKHFKSYKTVHKDKRAKKIVRAIGDKRMKKSATCALCHYSLVQKDSSGKPRVAGAERFEWQPNTPEAVAEQLVTKNLLRQIGKQLGGGPFIRINRLAFGLARG